jgi:hypothetical protein
MTRNFMEALVVFGEHDGTNGGTPSVMSAMKAAMVSEIVS